MANTELTSHAISRRRHARDIRAEQVRSVYLHSPTTTIASLVAGGALVAVMWQQVSNVALVGWMFMLCAHQALRVYHYRSYMKAAPSEQKHRRWGARFIMATATAGLIWGSSGLLMYVPDSLGHQAMLTLVLFGIATVSMTSLSAFAAAFYTLIPLLLLPIIVRMLLDPGPAQIYLAIPGIIVLIVVLSFGRTVNRIIAESLHKRFENLDLIEELRAQKVIAERSQQGAETANRSKTQFFAAASHDLRQPLHAIGLFASALAEKAAEPEVKQLVTSVNQSVQALESLFNELLDISKIDSGVIKPEARDFTTRDILERLRGEFAAEAAAKGLSFNITAPEAVVRSDPVLLERILRNLIANALRYTEAGEVTLSAERLTSTLRLAVRDTGMGILDADQQRIFEEFTQLQNPGRTSKKGLGLGLSIVKRLCDLMDYRITVNSRPGQGSVFSFEIQLGTEDPRPAASMPPPVAPRSDLSGRLIVVVDDEEAIVAGMEALLSSWGGEAIVSTTGDDVITRVHEAGRLPDLLIVDYRLGNGDTGIDVAQRLRQELDPEIPAVLVTGSITPDLEEKARAAGLAFLLKPVDPARLRQLIDATLSPATKGK